MLQKLQRQHKAQQQQLEKQIQLLQQQQQEMLLPPRVSGEGILGEPREPEGSQGRASWHSQSSGSAHLKDPANGVGGLEPAVPAAAGGACWWEWEGNEGCSVLRASSPLWECPRLLHNVEPLRKTNPHLGGLWRLRRGWAGGVSQSRSRGPAEEIAAAEGVEMQALVLDRDGLRRRSCRAQETTRGLLNSMPFI